MPVGAHRATATGGESTAHLPARPTAASLRHDRPSPGGPHGRASTGVTPVLSSLASQTCATGGPSAKPASSAAREDPQPRNPTSPQGQAANTALKITRDGEDHE